MIGQRATELTAHRRWVHDYGCYFMSIPAMCFEYVDPTTAITPARLIAYYDETTRTGAMGEQCYIQEPQEMSMFWTDKLLFLGHRPPDYDLADDERAIEKWQLARPNGGVWVHFTYGSYDPWPRSITRAEGELVGLRVWREN